jgi:hypothetical protein
VCIYVCIYICIYIYMLVTVVARSKAWVCGRSLTGIAGSNPAGGLDFRLLWMLCVFCVWLITRPEKSYWVWYVWVWSCNLDKEEAEEYCGLEFIVKVHTFLTSSLGGAAWSASRPGHFAPGDTFPGIPWIGGWVGTTAASNASQKINESHVLSRNFI